MKKRYTTVLICVVFLLALIILIGCGIGEEENIISPTRPPEGKRLTIYTSQPEEVYLPIIREFENRTGIWVEVETGSAVSKLESINAGEVNNCDLIFGCQAEVLEMNQELFAPYESLNTINILEEYLCPEQIWYPVAASHVVIIYNSKLVVKDQPAGWSSIFDTDWCKHVAYSDPEKTDIGYIILRTVASAQDCLPDDVEAKLSSDLRYDTSGEVIVAVASGSCHIGIVPEDVAIRAVTAGYDIRIVYPKEGVHTEMYAMAVFDSCSQKENAQKFIDFILEKEVQDYLQANFSFHSVYEQIDPAVFESLVMNERPDNEQTMPPLPALQPEEAEE